MKKILFSLVALVAAMSMNAQVMKVYKDGAVVAKFKAAQMDSVVYEEVPATNPLLPGSFSVSSTKTVQFTKSNLYWDGSAFQFEENPTDFPTTWDANHVGHFYWNTTAASACAQAYTAEDPRTSTDVFFADGSDVAHKLTIGGTSGLYVLSKDEWDYLVKTRANATSLIKHGVSVGNITCIIIAPDDYDFTTNPLKSSYTLEELEEAGLVCLPYVGERQDTSISSHTYYNANYWTATLRSEYSGYRLNAYGGGVYINDNSRSRAYGLRLVLSE